MLLLAVVGGITAVSGAMLGALLLVAMPQVAAAYPSLNNLMILLPGLAGISLARNPDGLVSTARGAARDVWQLAARRRTLRGSPRAEGPQLAPETPLPETLLPETLLPETVGLYRRASAAEIHALERGLGYATEECRGAP